MSGHALRQQRYEEAGRRMREAPLSLILAALRTIGALAGIAALILHFI
jgi:hypothetical protein